MLIEKSLWNRSLWSPLEGYVGVNKFNREEDYKDLLRNKKYSIIKLHKMHVSISWGYSFDNKSVLLNLDDIENCNFYYNGLKKILNRVPIDFKNYDGYAGKYVPPWIFPSYIKPLDNTQIFKIWESAFNVLKNTKKLVVIGYSFRPEDTIGQLLLANLPNDCKITVVDKYPKSIIKRLNTLKKEADEHYDSLKRFLSKQ